MKASPFLVSRPHQHLAIKSRQVQKSPPSNDPTTHLRGRAYNQHSDSLTTKAENGENQQWSHHDDDLVSHSSGNQHHPSVIYDHSSSTHTINSEAFSTLLIDSNVPFRASTARAFEGDLARTFPPGSVRVTLRYIESVEPFFFTTDPAALCELLMDEKELAALQRNARLRSNQQKILSTILEKYFNIPNDRYYLRFLNRDKSNVVGPSSDIMPPAVVLIQILHNWRRRVGKRCTRIMHDINICP